MPNSNSSQQTTDDSQQPSTTFPSVSVEDTLPPTITTTTTVTPNAVPQDTINPSPANSVPVDNGSAAPSNDLNISGVVGTTSPKKKFAGGKVIATILGLFLLVGGVGAGVFLTNQNQDIREKASTNNWQAPCTEIGCSASNYPTDWVNHYRCLDIKPSGEGCSDIEVATNVRSASFEFNCGTEQIDHSGNVGFTTIRHDQPCESEIACINAVVLYTEQGTMITDLSTLKAGQKVFLTIPIAYGASNTLNFTKARFTVNGVLRPEISAHKKFQVADVFYDEYTVTSGTTNVQAEVYYADAWYGK